MFEDGMHVVVGDISPEFEWASDLMSPYSDLVCGGENVPADMSWPVVEEMGEEEIMEESRHTEADM
jgi:hypothetical protein